MRLPAHHAVRLYVSPGLCSCRLRFPAPFRTMPDRWAPGSSPCPLHAPALALSLHGLLVGLESARPASASPKVAGLAHPAPPGLFAGRRCCA